MARNAEVHIDGLREVRQAFNDLPKELKRELPRELKKVAEIVAGDAAGRVPSKSGTAADSIKARSTGDSASVVGGKNSVPYYSWLDFGTRDPRFGNPRSAGPWKGSGTGPAKGRFIYPAIADNYDRIVDATWDAVEDAQRKVGL
jgi:hypothetical protein